MTLFGSNVLLTLCNVMLICGTECINRTNMLGCSTIFILCGSIVMNYYFIRRSLNECTYYYYYLLMNLFFCSLSFLCSCQRDSFFSSVIFWWMWTAAATKQPTSWMILWRSCDVDFFDELIQFNSFQFIWIFYFEPSRCKCAMVFFSFLYRFTIYSSNNSLLWIDEQRTTIILFEWHTKTNWILVSRYAIYHNVVFSSSTIIVTWHYTKRPKR